MKQLYIITGANGHLGSTIIRILRKRNTDVRGLILPDAALPDLKNIHYFTGDIRDLESLRPLFANIRHREVIVIHTAGIVDISEHITPLLYDVNVNGTKNVIALCQEYKIKRLVYVSSVHAIPEKQNLSVMEEIDCFSPDFVTGGYAKTKAEATQAVLDAAKNGLNAVVVHPSGIIGPFDDSGNHLVQLVENYAAGKLPACVDGGYDFVDVRDVACGCLRAASIGRTGQCYILSNRHYEVKDILQMVKNICGGKRLPTLPIWMAKAAAPLIGSISKARNIRPLYTKYSLDTLSCNDRFSHDKATRELNYHPRDLSKTIHDTVSYYYFNKHVPANTANHSKGKKVHRNTLLLHR